MKHLKLLALSLVAIISLSKQAMAITANASARVVTPITVTETTAMNFGSFASSAVAGTIDQTGAVTGGVTAVTGGAARTAGVFTVSGETVNGTPYTFTKPATATLTSGANNMTATLTFATGSASRTLDATGTDVVNLNGSLAVASNQATGLYTGTYVVTVAY